MKKKILCLGIVLILLICLTSCNSDDSNIVNIDAVLKSPDSSLVNFEIIDNNFYETILVDKNTGVMYCWITCSAGGITPIYNADGTLKLYKR